MDLTLKVKLLPADEQGRALLHTMETFNSACDHIGEVAFKNHTANKIRLQKLAYYDVRKRFGLPSQLTIRAISKVCEAYKRDKDVQPRFKPHGAMVYDQRIMSWKKFDRVSLLTLNGRELVPIVMDAYHKPRMGMMRGQADLIFIDGKFYLCVVVDVPEPPKLKSTESLGIDMGVVNIAVDSDGETFSGEAVDKVRSKMAKLKSALQSKGTKSAKRHLKRLSGHVGRFRKDVDHCISKKIVAKAKGTGRAIAVEDLNGIRKTGRTVRRAQRGRQSSWSFGQLRSFIEYKAGLAGVEVVAVDPRHTSQTCPKCHSVDRKNRDGQNFKCVLCGFAGNADHIAAINIAARADVNRPIVACSDTVVSGEHSYKPLNLFMGG